MNQIVKLPEEAEACIKARDLDQRKQEVKVLDYLDLLKDAEGQIPKEIFDGIDITWNRVTGRSSDWYKSQKTGINF